MGFFLFLFFVKITTAQLHHLDSIKLALRNSPKLLVKLDSKFSFVSHQLVSLRGIKVGANYVNKVKIGVGFSWMKDNFVFDNPTQLVNNDNYKLSVWSVPLFFDYTIYSDKNSAVLTNFDVAYSNFKYKPKKEILAQYNSNGVTFEPSAVFEYRLKKYFIFGGGLGYRFVFRNRKYIHEQFSAPIAIVRFKIDFVKVYQDLFNN